MKSIIKKITIALCALFAVVAIGFVMSEPVFADDDDCTSILPDSYCNGDEGEGIKSVVMMVINILTAGVLVAATVGLIWCGYLILTARDNESQVSTARKRMIEIAIGLIAWVLSAALANLIIPGGDQTGKLGEMGVIVTEVVQQ